MVRVVGFEVGNSGFQPVDDSGAPLAVGVWGDSDTGMGVFGTSGVVPAGVTVPSGEPAGVVGLSVQNPGVVGRSTSDNGVQGVSTSAAGVIGVSRDPSSAGVAGSNGAGGNGVFGIAGDASAVEGDSFRTGTGVFGGNFGDPGTGSPATGAGVSGYNENTGIGVYGQSDGAGTGVSGFCKVGDGVLGSTDTGIGVTGHAARPGAVGVVGFNESTNNSVGVHGFGTSIGVSGFSTTGSGVFGDSNTGSGVSAHSSAGNGVDAASDTGIGISGFSATAVGVSGDSNTSHGVVGSSENGIGVLGMTTGDTGGNCAVVALGGAGDGVFSVSNSNDAVVGFTGSTTGGGAIVGHADTGGGGFAGLFFGNVRITGSVLHGVAGFEVDHPLEPGGKYLRHSCVASPGMLNVYNGIVTSDENGKAVVTLPEYFEALNHVSGYQLTVIGKAAQAIVAQEVEGNQFTVQTTEPHVKVSWQVTGVRQDSWAVANPITVEEEKSPHEQGRYLHPAPWGQSKEAGIHRRSGAANQPDPNEDSLERVRALLPERCRELMEQHLQGILAGNRARREQREINREQREINRGQRGVVMARARERAIAISAAPPTMNAERLEEHKRELTEVTRRIHRLTS